MRCSQTLFATFAFLAAIGCSKDDAAGGNKKADAEPKVVAPPKSSLGAWKPFSPPSRSFRASYPLGNPIHWPFTGFDPPMNGPLLSGTHFNTGVGEQVEDRQTFSITEMKYAPKTPVMEREKALDEYMQTLAKLRKIKLSEPKEITWGGKPAKEYTATLTIELPSGKGELRIAYRALGTEKFAYVGSVLDGGKLSPENEKKFFDSFELLSDAGAKK